MHCMWVDYFLYSCLTASTSYVGILMYFSTENVLAQSKHGAAGNGRLVHAG